MLHLSRRCIRAALCAGAAVLITLSSARAGDPTGTWLVQKADAKVRVARCKNKLCAHVISIKDPIDPDTGKPWTDKNNADSRLRGRPLLGIPVAFAMKPDGTADRWIGRVYSVDHGRAFDGSLTLLGPRRLKIEGCVSTICDSEIWTRAD